MNTITRATLGFASGLALAAVSAPAAHAAAFPSPFDASMTNICGNVIVKFPCVYDKNGAGKLLGMPFSQAAIERQISGSWYLVIADPDTGLGNSVLFFYTTSNCTGQKYVERDGLIPFARYDGASFWGPDPQKSAVSVEYYSYSYGNPALCVNSQSYDAVILYPAAVLETKKFTPPFGVQ